MTERTVRTLWLAAVLLPGVALAGTTGVVATVEVSGVCCPTPVLDLSCLAAEVPLTTGEALTGFRWYNNDGTVPFPKVLVIPGEPGAVPAFELAAATVPDVVGVSSGWSEVSLGAAVTCTTGAVYVVFVLPAQQERTGIGAGTGPGFGYLDTPSGVKAHLSLDGVSWTGAQCHLAFTAVKVAQADGVAVLSGSSAEADKTQTGQPTVATGFQSINPNPFNPATTIRFGLRAPGRVSLALYNVRGQKVASLIDGDLPMGYHEREWRGVDDRGRVVPSGVYLARLRAEGRVFVQRLNLIR